MLSVKLSIEGMHCGHCVDHVSKALHTIEGVEVRHVAVGSAEVVFDPATTSPQAVTNALAEAGYRARASEAGGNDGCGCGCGAS